MRDTEKAFCALDEGQGLQTGHHALQDLQLVRRQQLLVFHDQQDDLLLAKGRLDLIVIGPLRVVDHQHLVRRDPDAQFANLCGSEDGCDKQE